jgi:hypothetical protein
MKKYNQPDVDNLIMPESPNQKELGGDIKKALAETDKGITYEHFSRGKSKKVVNSGEAGSTAYPNEDTILNEPDLLKHPY